MYAITLSDLESSSLDSDESCDGKGNFSTFMTIAHVESLDDLSLLVEELGEQTEMESIPSVRLEETYNSFFEKSGEYARVAKATIKKIKRVEEDYRSLLVRYKETKCEMETLK